MSSKKKVIAVAITTIALTAGSFGVADAASKGKTTTKTGFSANGIANPMANGNVKGGPAEKLAPVLAALVTKGTITQAQADAITAAVTAAEVAEHANDPKGPMGGGMGGALKIDKLAITASTLGIDSATIQSRLKAGETLATIAGAKKDALIAALVAAETKAIDAAVTAGTLTSAQATTLKTNLTAHVTDEVNAVRPADDKGGMGKGGRGGHGPMMGAAPTIPTPTASAKA